MSNVQFALAFVAVLGLILAQACQRWSGWRINEWFRGRP